MIDALAYHPDPYPHHARLRDDGVRRLADGRWVVATATGVAALLDDPSAIVGFTPRPDDRTAALQARMARFSDGADHTRRRAWCRRHLQHIDPGELRHRASALTRERIASARGIDVMEHIARDVPVAALAEALGVSDTRTAVTATRQLCLALAAPLGSPPVAGDDAAELLLALLRHTANDDEAVINALALLFQAMDATAGLIGNTLLAAHHHTGATDDVVVETARYDAPVQLTARLAAAPLHVDGHTIPAGDRVVVLLAAANRDVARYPQPDRFIADRRAHSFTFGAGRRACPGADHAVALTAGVLDAFMAAGTRLDVHGITYEHRPNLRIPLGLTAHATAGAR